jgi:hypothetical protein
VPVLPRLTVTQPVTAPYANSTNSTALQFSWDPAQMPFVVEEGKQLGGWVNQVNVPVYTPLDMATERTGTASVPQGLNGVAFAAITTQRYDNVNDLTLGTMADGEP